MPSKKKKYNARFPAGRIKKIMQTDEEVGKVAQAVPVIISRALELFIESLLTKSMQITLSRNAKTLTPSHMKQCILSESRFDFLKDLVKNIPDASVQEDNENNACFEAGNFDRSSIINEISNPNELNSSSQETRSPPRASFYTEQSTSSGSRTPVIQYGPKVSQESSGHLNFSISRLMNNQPKSGDSPYTGNSEAKDPELHITLVSQPLPVPELVPSSSNSSTSNCSSSSRVTPRGVAPAESVPSLVPLSLPYYSAQNTGDNLCIDEDYDN